MKRALKRVEIAHWANDNNVHFRFIREDAHMRIFTTLDCSTESKERLLCMLVNVPSQIVVGDTYLVIKYFL